MAIVCIIPARGGSKRIPRKNVRPFAGEPMIARAIRTARDADIFDRVLCSTDDQEIAAVARASGAEVPFERPAELADDHATTDAVLLHALRWLDASGTPARYACALYPTTPFTLGADIKRGLDRLRASGATTLIAVTTYPTSIWRALTSDDRGHIAMVWPEHVRTRTQDLPEAFHDAGQFYWLDVPRYLVEGAIFSRDAVGLPLPRHRVQDIDTPEDWERAELMFRASLRP